MECVHGNKKVCWLFFALQSSLNPVVAAQPIDLHAFTLCSQRIRMLQMYENRAAQVQNSANVDANKATGVK
jgi:hypothetical protein